tara:strand:+ start:319 stop:804 length:486 start_codon:yes stop_codon:yes gene_type:complete
MAKRNSSSIREGTVAEKEFIKLRGNNFVRHATRDEDIFEHWDVLDKEFGKVDVKAAKRFERRGPVDYTIWWELRTVKRPPNWKPTKGWGVPNGIDRFVAVRAKEAFYLLDPSDIISDLRKRCTDYFKGEFGLLTRPGRGDLVTILPLDYVIKNSRHTVEVS